MSATRRTTPGTIRMWPELTWRLDAINDAHATVTVFDHGQHAGQLTLARGTWDLLTGYRVGMDVPVSTTPKESHD